MVEALWLIHVSSNLCKTYYHQQEHQSLNFQSYYTRFLDNIEICFRVLTEYEIEWLYENWLNLKNIYIEGEHPAPFPEEIITLPILQTSKEFELILDPFMGSGTTGRVCDKVRRSFVGYDINYNQILFWSIIEHDPQ